jgi:2-polyprenyl-3-methyl-5-hydroxy-6-metoxy-1,4-benzoquinol methylase
MLKDTGERVIPDQMKPTNIMLLEHIARYHFSIPYAKGKVLDIACGAGFGTQIIAKAAKERLEQVVGVDIDESTITYAKARYYHPLIQFLCDNAVDPTLPERLGTFDTIISFETIEHIEQEQRFLENVYRLLKPGGTLVMSTPFGQGRGMPTNAAYHVHQLTEKEFQRLFHNYSFVDFYYQKGVLVEPRRKGVDIHYPIGIAVGIK